MKTMFKRSLITVLAIVMTTMSSGIVTAYATDVPDDDVSTVSDDNNIVSTTVNNTFTMGSYHRGGDRTYSTNQLYVRATITDVNGNAVDNNVTLVLRDYNGNAAYWNVSANGVMHTKTFNIVSGRMYYLEYYRSGTPRTLKVHMIIDSI